MWHSAVIAYMFMQILLQFRQIAFYFIRLRYIVCVRLSLCVYDVRVSPNVCMHETIELSRGKHNVVELLENEQNITRSGSAKWRSGEKKTSSHTNFLVHNFMWHCTKMLGWLHVQSTMWIINELWHVVWACVCVCAVRALWFYTKLKWARNEIIHTWSCKCFLFHVHGCHTMNVLQLQSRRLCNSLKICLSHNWNRIMGAFQSTFRLLFFNISQFLNWSGVHTSSKRWYCV